MKHDMYDDPGSPDLRAKLFREGKVVFLMSQNNAELLKSISQTDIKLDTISRKPGWKNRAYAKWLMVIGIVKSLYLTVRSRKTSDAFSFFAVNKGDIARVDVSKAPNNQVILTFHKKG